jgi:cystathionine gamma-lyase
VHAGLPPAAQGEPFLPGPTFAAPYHLAGDVDTTPYGYGREANPTWTRYEDALGQLEGGTAVVFSSGMAAASSVLLGLQPGDVLVAPSDGYPAVRTLALDHLEPRGIEVRLVPTDERAVRGALEGATLVWVETPSNPGLDVLELGALATDVHAAGARLAVDNTVATPLAQRPLELGADLSMGSATKYLSGHSDLLLGYVACADPARADALRHWRTVAGAVPGPFEVWLAHRSLATAGVRIERQRATAGAVAEMLRGRADVRDVRWPGIGAVVTFELPGEDEANAFFAASDLVAEATSFGGVHTSAERRARWQGNDVAPGFIRFSAGIEDTEDVVADVAAALDAVAARA